MIKEFHIHLYYDENSIHTARALVDKIQAENYEVGVGRFHEKPVGPHPMWSVQLLISKEDFGSALSFVALQREGLIVFSHPITGDDLKDHTDYAIWMGDIVELKLEIFK